MEKINNDRKHVKLIIYFNFNMDIVDKELDLYEKKSFPKKKEESSDDVSSFSSKLKCSHIDSNIRCGEYRNINIIDGNVNISNFVDTKCSCIDWNESRFC